jgi:guanine nucleotide-binding protein G(s) subunit alpha
LLLLLLLLLQMFPLGPGESGKSTIVKQMRIIHTSRYTVKERRQIIGDIISNIRDAILSILDAMDRFKIELENIELNKDREFVYEYSHLLSQTQINTRSSHPGIETSTVMWQKQQKLWTSIERLWSDGGVQKCAKRGNEFHLIDSAAYFLDRVSIIRQDSYLPDDQDILRCRVLTTGIFETSFSMNKVFFHLFDVGGQRDQRRKWIQCFNEVTAIIFVVDISSFNTTLREDPNVNRLVESLETFRQIWINRYLYRISVILFLNKYDTFVKKIVEENFKLSDYFPAYNSFQMPDKINKHLFIADEHPEVTRSRMFILEQFISITNERLCDAMNKVISYETNTINRNQAESVKEKLYQVPGEPNANTSQQPLVINSTTSQNESNQIDGQSSKEENPKSTDDTQIGEELTLSRTNKKYEKLLRRQIRESYKEAEEENMSGKFCIPYFTCAVDSDNIKRVFKACSHILKKEHLEKCGLL